MENSIVPQIRTSRWSHCAASSVHIERIVGQFFLTAASKKYPF